MMCKDPVSTYCPVCDEKRITEVDKYLTTGGWIYICIMLFICWPAIICALCDSNNWGHSHKCNVCKTTLYKKT